jgi:hypothetical protein
MMLNRLLDLIYVKKREKPWHSQKLQKFDQSGISLVFHLVVLAKEHMKRKNSNQIEDEGSLEIVFGNRLYFTNCSIGLSVVILLQETEDQIKTEQAFGDVLDNLGIYFSWIAESGVIALCEDVDAGRQQH